MTEYVFKRSRLVNGKRMFARLFSGRYTLGPGEPRVTVPLHTPDELVARKRLRDIVIEAQREREGMIAPKSVRAAAAAPLVELIADYALDLRGRELDAKHVHDTVKRLERMSNEANWSKLADVRPESFVKWRAGFSGSAKTRKEYQISVNAFLNWLVRVDRLVANPLVKVDRIDTRGKQARPYRAYTADELRRLLVSVSRERRMAYLVLVYTGQRRSEIASLVVGDVSLGQPAFVLIRVETTKDKDKRAIPLHPMLAAELRRFIPPNAAPADPVFPEFPSYDALVADLKRAGIERKDALGRVVHFHSFRKTWQTMGVNSGISQRVAQEILGHSDPALTANVYTDVPAVGMHDEIAKLPWIPGAPQSAPSAPKTGALDPIRRILGELVTLAKAVGDEGNLAISEAIAGSAQWLPGLGSNQRPSD